MVRAPFQHHDSRRSPRAFPPVRGLLRVHTSQTPVLAVSRAQSVKSRGGRPRTCSTPSETCSTPAEAYSERWERMTADRSPTVWSPCWVIRCPAILAVPDLAEHRLTQE